MNWKKILMKLGFFAMEIGISILADLLFGKDGKKGIKDFIEMINNENMTGQQKYEAVKEYVDQLKVDAPDTIKNLIIEGLVSSANRVLDKLEEKI